MEAPTGTPAAGKPSKPANGNGNKLNAAERAKLDRYEAQLQHHFETFRTAGEALLGIRDARLYREHFATFEDYCRTKWDMSKTQANRLIAAAKVVENISSVAPEEAKHLTESVIRSLATLEPKDQKKAFAKAVKAAPAATGVTAKVVAQAAREVAPSAFKKPNVGGGGAGSGRTTNGDLIRRTELLDEINAWEREQRTSKKFDSLTPRQVMTAVRQIIKGL